MPTLIKSNGGLEVIKGLALSTTPTPFSEPKWPMFAPKFATKYSVDSSGNRISNGEPRPAKHRLLYQSDVTDKRAQNMYRENYYYYPYIWEKPNNMGDKLIKVSISDITWSIANILQYGTSDYCRTTHPGRWQTFQCRKKNLSGNVFYSLGYVSPDVNGGAYNWIFNNVNVNSCYSYASPIVTGASYTPYTDDAVRDLTFYNYHQYFALNSGDKLIYRIKWNNLDATKNLGFGNGVEFVHFFITDLSKQGEFNGVNRPYASLNGNALNDGSSEATEYTTWSNDLCFISGPTDELSAFGQMKDAAITSNTGEDTWSVTVS